MQLNATKLTKVAFGGALLCYVALFTLVALTEWAWPKKRACDCQDQWKDGV